MYGHFRHTPTTRNCRPFGCVLLLNQIYLTTAVPFDNVKACSRETHSPSRASKIYGHKAFQITHIQTAVINIITVDDLSDFGKGQAFVYSISIFLLSFLFIVYFCLYVYFYFLLMLPSLVNKDV